MEMHIWAERCREGKVQGRLFPEEPHIDQHKQDTSGEALTTNS